MVVCILNNSLDVVALIAGWNCVQNPASGDALTKLQDDVDETKIVLVSYIVRCILYQTIFTLEHSRKHVFEYCEQTWVTEKELWNSVVESELSFVNGC